MRSTQTEPTFVPYNWTTNRPKESSKDFKAVMSWLTDHGAPLPTIIMIPFDAAGWQYPGTGIFPGEVMFFAFPGDVNPRDAAAVMNSPGVVLKELGIVPDDINYTPPTAPAAAPPPPTTHIGQPLGNGWFTQTDAETDTAKDGDKVTGPDGVEYVFVKGVIGGWYHTAPYEVKR